MKMVVANWKMNHLRQDALAFCRKSWPLPAGGRRGRGHAPPLPLLEAVSRELEGLMPVYGQNAHAAPEGAFTGEVSMALFQDAGCSGVLLGHSERRQYF